MLALYSSPKQRNNNALCVWKSSPTFYVACATILALSVYHVMTSTMPDSSTGSTIQTSAALADAVKPRTAGPRKVYIDLGANCGNTYWRMKNSIATGSEETLSTPDWEAYLWECNPQLIEWYLNDLIATESANGNTVQLIPKAASTEDGTATFFLTAGQESATKDQLPNSECDPNSAYNPGGASSLYGSAKRAGKSTTVPTADFFA